MTVRQSWKAPDRGGQPCDLRFWSGWPDSNRRPPAPKAGALTKLRYIPGNRSVAYRAGPFPPGAGNGPAGRRAHAVTPAGRDSTGTLSVRIGAGPTPHRTRGRSSMAEPQPSKLVMRVRFPSPALTQNPRLRPGQLVGLPPSGRLVLPACPSRARSALRGALPPGRSEHLSHRRRDRLIPLPRGVLIDQRGPRA
jgi:hypothetical protein